MKNANTFLLTTLFSAGIAVLASLAVKPDAHSSVIRPAVDPTEIAVLTVTAPRMSEAQKAAYDSEQAAMPTMVVTAKRMSEAQKAEFDRTQAAAAH